MKKKLDSYLASGLLEQFQGLPPVGHQNHLMPLPSSRMQMSGDDSGRKGGNEGDEISECSQDSAGNLMLQKKQQFLLTEESQLVKDQSSSPASCSEQFYTTLEDVTIPMPGIPCEIASSSKFPEQNFRQEAGTLPNQDYQLNLQDLSSLSAIEIGNHQSSGLPAHCIAPHENHGVATVPYQSSVELSVPGGTDNLAAGSSKSEHILIPDDECCRVLFAEAMKDGCFPFESFTQGMTMIEPADCQSSGIQIPEGCRTSPSQASCPPEPGVFGSPCSQALMSAPTLLSSGHGACVYARESNVLSSQCYGTQEQINTVDEPDDFIHTNEFVNSPCDEDTENPGLQGPSYVPQESQTLVHVNTYGPASETTRACSSGVVKIEALKEEKETGGALCYEPPRFPSLDIPFFSCDLIQSGSDMQQEYSPLGIRQLMMSSMNCISPFRLWDSPSRDKSPEAVLKSAAKTFTGTPSILKKRTRDLLSPLSDRRTDKKLETDLTSNLARDFSRLEFMIDEAGTHKGSILSPSTNPKRISVTFVEDKENQRDATCGGPEIGKDTCAVSEGKSVDKDCDSSKVEQKNDAKTKIDGADTATGNVSPVFHFCSLYFSFEGCFIVVRI